MEKIQINDTQGINFNISYLKASAPSNKIILISPATGVRKHLYQPFAEYLSQNHFNVITWDWEGIADNLSGNIKTCKIKMEDWAKQNLNSVIDWVSDQYPSHQIFIIGHSFGGQALGLAEQIYKVQAIVTVASQSGYWKHWPIQWRYQMATLWYGVMPLLSNTLGFFPSKYLGMGENLPKGVALQWAKWCRSANYLGDYTGHEKMTQKILAFYFTDDVFAPKQAVEALHQHFSNSDIHYRRISPCDLEVAQIGHFGFFKKDEAQKLWLEIIDFFND